MSADSARARLAARVLGEDALRFVARHPLSPWAK
jgi:hypothetical protein